jgi:Leucine-rich repeat (LRR) protein
MSLFSPQVLAEDNDGNAQSYDEESFYKVFTDIEFGKQVLKALGINLDNVDWSLVNDESLGSIKNIKLANEIFSLKGIEKLSGLEELYIHKTRVDKFPDNIEKNLKNLKSLSLDNNQKPLTVPAFASLTEFFALSGQAIKMESKGSIELMSNLKTLHLSGSKIANSMSVSKVIDYSKFKELENLYICDNGLDSLPESIKDLNKLKVLDTSSNSIGSVPKGFFQSLKNIVHLRMSDCKLSSIPDDIFNISNLSYLDISDNDITLLPSSNNVLSSCASLNLSGNKINGYPIEFFDSFPNLFSLYLMDCGLNEIPKSLLSLENLRYLSLEKNPLKNIKDEGNFIKNFTNLQVLNLGNCQLSEFPVEIGELPNLYNLFLYNNNIRHFPNSDDIEGKFDNLSTLVMSVNNLTEFPDLKCFPNIKNLNLQGNFINSIPDDIDLSKMDYGYIDLSFNYFTSIPKIFIEQAKPNFRINLSKNFIKYDDTLPESIEISPNQLIFSDIPLYLVSNQSIDMSLYLSTNDKLYSTVSEDIYGVKNLMPVEFTVSKDGIIIDRLIDNQGKLIIADKGVYEISAKLKDAEESNSYAKATATVNVIDNNDFYNEEKFKATFPDEVFRVKVLNALNQFHYNGNVDYTAVKWDMITDVAFAQIKSLGVFNNISNLKGLEKLTGLESLHLFDSKIKGFPEEIEKKLVNLKTLKLADSVNKITIPKFVNLTELICGDLSEQAITGVQNISKDSVDSINSMKSLTRLELNNARDMETNVNIAEIVDYSKFENLEYISLGCNEFEELPKGISGLKKLVSMDLSNNNLKTLPDYFETSFNNLRELRLRNCKFDSIPEVITKIPTLNTIDIGKNNVKEIPMEKGLSRLKSLKHLFLYECGLASFPEGVLELENLEYLNLSGNHIKSLPPSMDSMKSLRMLELSNCEFEKFPDEILDIEFLEGVSFDNNVSLKFVPGGANGIGKLKNLAQIVLSNCSLDELPDFSSNFNLRSLDLENNNILEIPKSYDLSETKVRSVNLSNNNLSKIPEFIIDEAKNYVRSYNFNFNYLHFEDETMYGLLWIVSSKVLSFKPYMLQSIKISDKVDLKDYIVYKIGGEIKDNIGLDNAVEYSYIDSQGNVKAIENGILSIDKPGRYIVKGVIKGAEPTNPYAVATVELYVKDTTPTATQASQAPLPPLQASAQVSPTPTPTSAVVTIPVDDKGIPAVNPNGLIITSDKNKTIVEVKAGDDYIAKMIKNKVCEIDLFKEINTESSMVSIPESFIKSLNVKGINEIRLITPFITISFNIKEFVSKDISKLTLNLGKMSDGSLTKEQKGVVGPSEVIQMVFEVENTDGKKTVIKKSQSPVSIKVPYEPAGKNERITLYSLGADGETENLAAKYDETLKAVTAKTKIIAPVSAVNNSIQYNDVKKGNWAQNYIEAMSSKGIIKGYEKGIFKPDLNISRAEFASIITRLLKLEANDTGISFTDIKEGDWYKDAVMAAAEARIITGWKGKFKPNDRITREDAAVMISRALTYIKGLADDDSGELMFRDKKKISLYAEEHIRFVVGKKVMSGKADNYFDPKGYTTRAEVAKMVYMLFEQI